MGVYVTNTNELTAVADAIRQKGDTASQLEYPDGFVSAIDSIPLINDVVYVDYDGTILHSYTAAQFATLTAHPANPTHTGLTAQGWNWTLSDAKTHVATYGQLVIGQNYITTSGKTEIDITISDSELLRYSWSLYFRLYKNAIINWGDGTGDQTVTGGASSISYVSADHWYSQTGNYTITIEPVAADNAYFDLGAASTSAPNILRFTNDNMAASLSIRHIRFGRDIRIGNSFYMLGNLGNLETVTIPAYFGDYTSLTSRFCYNSNLLKCVVIPYGVTEIKVESFFNCGRIEFISLPKSITTFSGTAVFQRCGSLKMLTIPEGPTSIPNTFVGNGTSLKKCYIPSGVQSIGEAAFSGCSTLQEISIPSSVTSVEKSAFYSCNSLKSLVFPSAITAGATAFAYSYGLKEISFPNGATFTDTTTMFTACYGLVKAYIPAGITTIKTQFCRNCWSLIDIEIPNSVTTIESYAFQGCYSLHRVIVPSGVTSIEANAFANTKPLYYVFQSTIPPTLEAASALSSSGSGPIYVPSESVNAYKTASNWSSYASRIEAIPEGLLD